jgi:hypothetical protein
LISKRRRKGKKRKRKKQADFKKRSNYSIVKFIIAQYQVELCTLPLGRIPAPTHGIPAKAGLKYSLKWHDIPLDIEQLLKFD